MWPSWPVPWASRRWWECRHLVGEVQDGDLIIVDGNKGLVVVNPNPQTLKQYQRLKESYEAFQHSLEELRALPAVTPDGHEVTLAANIEIPLELDEIFRHGAEGVGLFRTEFLFLDRAEVPTEEEQYEAYREPGRQGGGQPRHHPDTGPGRGQVSRPSELPARIQPLPGACAPSGSVSNAPTFSSPS